MCDDLFNFLLGSKQQMERTYERREADPVGRKPNDIGNLSADEAARAKEFAEACRNAQPGEAGWLPPGMDPVDVMRALRGSRDGDPSDHGLPDNNPNRRDAILEEVEKMLADREGEPSVEDVRDELKSALLKAGIDPDEILLPREEVEAASADWREKRDEHIRKLEEEAIGTGPIDPESNKWWRNRGSLAYEPIDYMAGVRSYRALRDGDFSDHGLPDNNPKTRYGIKKPPLHLIPPAAKVELAAAMGEGARKYGAYNWREKKVSASVYVAAAGRHLDAFWDGESLDPESKAHHLGHAMACCAILLDALATGNLIDDRPMPGMAGELHRAYAAKMEMTDV